MADHRVSPLKKSDLQFDYGAHAMGDDNPSLRGHPDSDLLNRSEQYEVLYFVNKFANDYGEGSAEVAKKAERLIHRYLPPDIRSRAKITDWMIRNWKMFGDAPIKK